MLGRTPSSSLRQHDWERRYSSDQHNLVDDFYKPALAAAKFYDRAVGYFALSSLKVIGEALEPFWETGERMRLVASVKIQERDKPHIAAAHELGREQRQHFQEEALTEEVSRFVPEFAEPIKLFTALIEYGLLKLYIATGLREPPSAWFYHEKIGVMVDHRGDFVTFEGSPNETGPALSPSYGNIESFPVHRSWVPGENPHAVAAKAAVDGLFPPNPSRNVKVVPFPQAQLDKLLETYEPEKPSGGKSRRRPPVGNSGDTHQHELEETEPEMPALPDGIALHDYQEEAVVQWQEADGLGRFEMATGTGKTITALAATIRACAAVVEAGESLLIVVIVPDQALVRQWTQEAEEFGFRRVVTSEQPQWRDKVTNQLEALRFKVQDFGVVIATVDGALASSGALLAQLKSHRGEEHDSKLMLIADEAHSLGAPTYRQVLLEEFDYRLALSATFERHFDEEGTEFLEDYFRGSVATVTMDEAIHVHKTLVPYTFHPVLVELTEEEQREYVELSGRISMAYARADGDSWHNFENASSFLLRKRASILKHAANKIPQVRDVIEGLELKKYLLVYAAEGPSPLTDERQDTQLVELLRGFGMDTEIYDGGTPDNTRKHYEERLDEGRLHALVAMKCLDQGIDIPEARTALFVASTTNPRQYVQRRGRILRRPKRSSSNKDSADLYDFIVVPPEPTPETFEIEKKLVARELLRARTLAYSASNRFAALEALLPVIKAYRLEDQPL